MYRQVVVLLDGSELAERVLPLVAAVIRGRGSRVYLLSVVPTARGLPFPREREDVEQARRSLQAYLDEVAQRLMPVAAAVQTVVRAGRPAEEILAFVGEVEADLIAMSTHGRSGLSRWVFGSVADRVLRGATCPVLLVRAQGKRGAAAPPPDGYQRLLLPLDGSELAEQVIPYVKALIRPHETGVHLVSVLTVGLGERTVTLLTSYPPGLTLAAPALHQAEVELRAYLRSVAAVMREQGALTSISIRHGSPPDEILACAAEVEADMICMTTHGLSGASRWVYGNVADRVLQGAHCPVLLVRPTFKQGDG